MHSFPSISGHLLHHARLNPQKNAFIFLEDGESVELKLSYAELVAKASLVAQTLENHSLTQKPVLLLYPPGLDFIISFFACQLAGVIAVPLYPPRGSRHAERLVSILEDAGATFILTHEKLAAKIRKGLPDFFESGGTLICSDSLVDQSLTSPYTPRESSTELSFIQYTSGSTGTPKGVIITQANLLHNESLLAEAFQQTQDSVLCSWLPFYHDMGLIGNIIHSVYVGASCVLMSPFHFIQQPLRWLKAIDKYKVTFSGAPNFGYDLCVSKISEADRNQLSLSSWAYAYNGAEVVRAATLESFADYFVPANFDPHSLYPCYGLAEATLFVAGGPRQGWKAGLKTDQGVAAWETDASSQGKIVASGSIREGMEIRIIDPETGNECSPSGEGEICIAGNSVSNGYWNREKDPKDYWQDPQSKKGYLRTGDLGALFQQQLFVTGRIKELIIQRGRNYYPYDLENIAAAAHPALAENGTAAFSVTLGNTEEVVLFLEVKRSHYREIKEAEIFQAVWPALVEALGVEVYDLVLLKPMGLPKTSSGKIRRRHCASLYLAGNYPQLGSWRTASPTLEVPTSTSLSESLAAFQAQPSLASATQYLHAQIEQILAQPTPVPNPETELISLGLYSLKLMELSAHIQEDLQLEIEPGALINGMTFGELCQQLLSSDKVSVPDFLPTPAPKDNQVSANQQALWILDQKQAAPNHIGFRFQLEGVFEVEKWQAAFQAIAKKHPVLLSSFSWKNGAIQTVGEVDSLLLPIEQKLIHSTEEAQKWVNDQFSRPFNLAHPPLIRLAVASISETQHYLCWVMHHIIGDGWSLQLLFKELVNQLTGNEGALPAAYSYRDFTHWETNLIESDRFAASVDHFAVQLYQEEKQSPLTLPPGLPEKGPQLYQFEIPRKQVFALADHYKVSPFLLLLGVFHLQLLFTGNAQKVITASPATRRNLPQWRSTLGYLVNLLFLPSEWNPDQSWPEFLASLQAQFQTAFGYQDLPYTELLRSLNTKGIENDPFEQFMFAYQALDAFPDFQKLLTTEGVSVTELGKEAHIKSWEMAPQSGVFPFEMEVLEGKDQLHAWIKYEGAQYSAFFVERFALNFQTLLDSIEAAPALPLSSHKYLSVDQTKELLKWSQGPEISWPNDHFLDGFSQGVQDFPDRLALKDSGVSFTYRELDHYASQLAQIFQNQHQVEPGDRVGIYWRQKAPEIVAILALWKLGAAYVPVDEKMPKDRIQFILENSSTQLVVYTGEIPVTTAKKAVSWIPIPPFQQDSDKIDIPKPPLNQEAYMIYTSGTSGTPKGVPVRHTALLNLCASMRLGYEVQPTDRMLQFSSLTFDMSVEEIFPYLFFGAAVVLRNPESLESFAQFQAYCEQEKITLLNLPTAFWQELLFAENRFPKSVRLLSAGGDRMQGSAVSKWFEAYGNSPVLFNAYGPTEYTVNACLKKITDSIGAHVSIGKALPNTETLILNAQQQILPIGVPGELCLSGHGLAEGYWNRSALTHEKFIAHPFRAGKTLYRTGDLAYWNENGEITVMGRIDQQVKIRGFRVELREIEAQLEAIEGVEQAVVLYESPHLRAWVKGAKSLKETSLSTALQAHLPDYMLPTQWVFLDRMPLNLNGKIDRKALPHPDRVSQKAFPPRTQIERTLMEIWEEILEKKPAGIQDDFFALGGNSLKAIRLNGRYAEAFQTQLPLKSLFSYRTLEQQAAQLEGISPLPLNKQIEKLPESSDYALSPGQHRLWVLSQFSQTAAAYELYTCLKIQGHVNETALRQAFLAVMNRHEILRTSFNPSPDSDTPRQKIWETNTVSLPLTIRSLPSEPEPKILVAIQALESEILDLAQAPLWKIIWFRGPNETSFLYIQMHHIISDAWSKDILLRDFFAAYQAQEKGIEVRLPELSIQYKDFASWQAYQHSSPSWEKVTAYWKAQFSGSLPLLELPTDHPRPAHKSFAGETLRFSIPAAQKQGLLELVNSHQTTLYTGLLALVKVILYQYSGQTDIVIGTPVSGRERPELTDQVGFYVNTLALRSQLDPAKGFIQFLETLNTQVLDAFEYGNYPFDQLVEALDLPRHPNRSPLFDVMVVMLSNETAGNEIRSFTPDGWKVSNINLPSDTSQFDLTFNFIETPEEIQLEIEFDSDLFVSNTIQRMGTHFQYVLEQILQQANTPLVELPKVSEAETTLLLTEFGQSGNYEIPEKSVMDLIGAFMVDCPNAVALSDPQTRLSYSELNEISSQFAQFLYQEKGVRKGQYVGIQLYRSSWTVISMLAIWKCGAAYIPLDPDAPAKRTQLIREDAEIEVNIEEKVIADFQQFDPPYDGITLPGFALDEVAYLIYTSGTTGRPKGVMISHLNLGNKIQEEILCLPQGETWNSALITHPVFDVSLLDICLSLCTGGHLTIPPATLLLDPIGLGTLFLKEKVNMIQTTPAFLKSLMAVWSPELCAELNTQFTLICSGGESLEQGLVNQFKKSLPDVQLNNHYGPTEITIDALFLPDVKTFDRNFIGKPIGNTRVYLLDAHHQLVPPGQPGEICVGGKSVALGYHNRPVLNAEKFISNPFAPDELLYTTGDMGIFHPDGNIQFLGRKDDQIKLRGYRIELGEIESAFYSIAGIEEAVVLVVELMEGNPTLMGWVAGAELPDENLIRTHLKGIIPAYMVPDILVSLPALPLNVNGKIDKSRLREEAKGYERKKAPYIAPVSDTEIRLVKVWETLLNHTPIGVSDDFFILGGHSLIAVRLVAQIQKEFGIQLKLESVFTLLTIAELGSYIDSILWTQESPAGGAENEIVI